VQKEVRQFMRHCEPNLVGWHASIDEYEAVSTMRDQEAAKCSFYYLKCP
jgi:hypothetical protein